MKSLVLVCLITFGVLILAVDEYDSYQQVNAEPRQLQAATAAPSQCKDSTGKFLIPGDPDPHGCIWVSNFKKERCTYTIAQQKCPVTCGTCPGTSKPPSPKPTVVRTVAPTQCKDSSLKFLIPGDPDPHGCIWVASFKKERCTYTIAQQKCPVTCDTCPGTSKPPSPKPTVVRTVAPTQCKDSTLKFLIPGDPDPHGCIWVASFKKERCTYTIAQQKCPVTCDTCPGTSKPPSPKPTVVRTVAPTQCKDSSLKFLIPGDPDPHGCIWVASFKKERCTYTIAQQKCPVTCDTCPGTSKPPSPKPTVVRTVAPTQCKDSTLKFLIPGDPDPHGCIWVASFKKERCTYTIAQQKCPVTCDTCPGTSKPPSSRPTTRPEAQPSARPSSRPTTGTSEKPIRPSAKPSNRPTSEPSIQKSLFPTLTCVDSTAFFRWSNNKARDCVWVSSHPRSCTYDIAQVYCPLTCGTCPKPNIHPTPNPTRQLSMTYGPQLARTLVTESEEEKNEFY